MFRRKGQIAIDQEHVHPTVALQERLLTGRVGQVTLPGGVAIVSGGIALASSETIVGGVTFGTVAGASELVSLGASGVKAGAQYLDRNYGGLQETIAGLVFSLGMNVSFGRLVANSIGSAASKAAQRYGVGVGVEVASQFLDNVCTYYVPNE